MQIARKSNLDCRGHSTQSARIPTCMAYRRIISTTGIEDHQFSTIVMTTFSRIQMPAAM